jgi:hypothetical protein
VPNDVSALLLKGAGFTAADLDTLLSGRVISRTEANPEELEAFAAAAVRIATTKERALDYFNLLVSYVDGQVTLGYGAMSRPPVDMDVNKLSLDPADITDMQACAPGKCEVRIGAASVSQVSRAADWSSLDANMNANNFARQQFVRFADDYIKRGDAALVSYDDTGTTVNLAQQWRAIFGKSQTLTMLAPDLAGYLTSLPAARPSAATEVIYWDKQHYTSLKPVVGITHEVTWRDPAKPDRIVIVQRQIAATHYFYGSLAVTLILQETGQAGPATYVVYTNRLRGDLLKGTQAPAQTGIRARLRGLSAQVQRRMGEEMAKQSAERLMGAMKQALEQQ